MSVPALTDQTSLQLRYVPEVKSPSSWWPDPALEFSSPAIWS